jgi:hypothetical protein
MPCTYSYPSEIADQQYIWTDVTQCHLTPCVLQAQENNGDYQDTLEQNLSEADEPD